MTTFAIEGDYGYGWEVVTYADDRADAATLLNDYVMNNPFVVYRIRIYADRLQNPFRSEREDR